VIVLPASGIGSDQRGAARRGMVGASEKPQVQAMKASERGKLPEERVPAEQEVAEYEAKWMGNIVTEGEAEQRGDERERSALRYLNGT